MQFKKMILCSVLVICTGQLVEAEESCLLQPGWTMHTHGTHSDQVWLWGKLSPSASDKWMLIYNQSSKFSKSNIAIALTALTLKKSLRIYVEETCSTFTNWNGVIRHLSIEAN